MLASVLVGFAALLAAPQAAHAVDKEIWSATLTAAASSTLATETEFGYARGEFGILSSEGPLPGLQAAVGPRYVYSLTNDHGILGGQLQLSVDPEGTGYTDPLETTDFVKRLTLHLDASSFVGSAYAHIPNRFIWNNSGLTWTAGQMIAVRLTFEVPGIQSIEFTSSPATGTTYDTGESVSATVTFDEAVDVTGTPQLTIDMGGSDKVLDYSSGTGTTALVFSGYTVALGDTDADGLSIAANKLDLNGGTIKATADENPNADLTHGAVAASSSHKVDGATAPPAPTVDSIAFNDAGTDGAFKTDDAVTATVTFDESVTVDTTDGTPQLTIKMGGADKVLDYSSGSGTTALVFSGYTVAANDEDTDGLSIEANKLDANGGTIKETADATVDAVLTHAAVAASANHKVDGVKPTLVTTGDDAPKTSVDGSKIILNFSENIGSVDTTKITVKVGTTDQTISSGSRSGTEVELTLSTALSATATNITVALAADAVTDVPGNGIAAVSATSVIRASAPGKPTLTLAAKDQSIDATVVFSAHGTSDITKYQYQIKSGSDAFGSWTDSTKNLSNTGGTFTIGSLTNGTEYTVKVRGVNSDGEGAESDAKTATPDAAPKITSVAITSTPTTANTYIIGEDIEFTVTFDKTLTLAGSNPSRSAGNLPFLTDDTEDDPNVDSPEAPCAIGTDTKTLVCTDTVGTGWYDNDGIAVFQNSLFPVAGVEGPLGQRANFDHSGLAADSDHKVDGIRPTLSRADADPNDLTKIILTFSEAIGTVDNTKITVKKGMTDQTIDSVAIDSTDATKVVVTLDTALLSTDTNITVDLAADAVKDVPGNGIAEVLGTSVSVEDNVAPTLESAQVIAGNPRSVVLIFDEALASGSTPATSRFTVKVEGNSRTPSSVSRPVGMPKRISLTLGPTQGMRPGDTVTVSYTKPGSNPLKDAADNEVESFTDVAVTNNLAATAPDAPSSLFLADITVPSQLANEYADRLGLLWTTPWHNGSDITKFQYRYAEGTSVPTTTGWTDIPDSAPTEQNSNSYTVEGLDPGTQYTFEVRAVNGIGGGDEKAAMDTTSAPAWSFTLRDASNNNVTQLTEGGDSATATVSITNNVRFGADQTVALKWGPNTIDSGLIEGAGGATAITVAAEQSSGSLVISSPQGAVEIYFPRTVLALTATHGDTEIGSIDLAYVDDEGVPVASITQAPTSVNEGDSIEIEVTLTVGYAGTGAVKFTVTDADGALSGTPPDSVLLSAGITERTVTLTAAENTTQDDGARDVTFALALNDDTPYTLGTAPAVTSVTITVRDDDTPPLAVRNLTAQAGDTEATLRWEAPAPSSPDHGQPVLHYEYRVKTTGSFGSWTRFPNSDADTRSHTFTGLTNDQEHTYQVRAVNVAGGGASRREERDAPRGHCGVVRRGDAVGRRGRSGHGDGDAGVGAGGWGDGDGADRGDAGHGAEQQRVFGRADERGVQRRRHLGELHGDGGAGHGRRAGPAADVLVRHAAAGGLRSGDEFAAGPDAGGRRRSDRLGVVRCGDGGGAGRHVAAGDGEPEPGAGARGDGADPGDAGRGAGQQRV